MRWWLTSLWLFLMTAFYGTDIHKLVLKHGGWTGYTAAGDFWCVVYSVVWLAEIFLPRIAAKSVAAGASYAKDQLLVDGSARAGVYLLVFLLLLLYDLLCAAVVHQLLAKSGGFRHGVWWFYWDPSKIVENSQLSWEVGFAIVPTAVFLPASQVSTLVIQPLSFPFSFTHVVGTDGNHLIGAGSGRESFYLMLFPVLFAYLLDPGRSSHFFSWFGGLLHPFWTVHIGGVLNQPGRPYELQLHFQWQLLKVMSMFSSQFVQYLLPYHSQVWSLGCQAHTNFQVYLRSAKVILSPLYFTQHKLVGCTQWLSLVYIPAAGYSQFALLERTVWPLFLLLTVQTLIVLIRVDHLMWKYKVSDMKIRAVDVLWRYKTTLEYASDFCKQVVASLKGQLSVHHHIPAGVSAPVLLFLYLFLVSISSSPGIFPSMLFSPPGVHFQRIFYKGPKGFYFFPDELWRVSFHLLAVPVRLVVCLMWKFMSFGLRVGKSNCKTATIFGYDAYKLVQILCVIQTSSFWLHGIEATVVIFLAIVSMKATLSWCREEVQRSRHYTVYICWIYVISHIMGELSLSEITPVISLIRDFLRWKFRLFFYDWWVEMVIPIRTCQQLVCQKWKCNLLSSYFWSVENSTITYRLFKLLWPTIFCVSGHLTGTDTTLLQGRVLFLQVTNSVAFIPRAALFVITAVVHPQQHKHCSTPGKQTPSSARRNEVAEVWLLIFSHSMDLGDIGLRHFRFLLVNMSNSINWAWLLQLPLTFLVSLDRRMCLPRRVSYLLFPILEDKDIFQGEVMSCTQRVNRVVCHPLSV